jgi:hypothetical protein
MTLDNEQILCPLLMRAPSTGGENSLNEAKKQLATQEGRHYQRFKFEVQTGKSSPARRVCADTEVI